MTTIDVFLYAGEVLSIGRSVRRGFMIRAQGAFFRRDNARRSPVHLAMISRSTSSRFSAATWPILGGERLSRKLFVWKTSKISCSTLFTRSCIFKIGPP